MFLCLLFVANYCVLYVCFSSCRRSVLNTFNLCAFWCLQSHTPVRCGVILNPVVTNCCFFSAVLGTSFLLLCSIHDVMGAVSQCHYLIYAGAVACAAFLDRPPWTDGLCLYPQQYLEGSHVLGSLRVSWTFLSMSLCFS